jgi:hypothetical protein
MERRSIHIGVDGDGCDPHLVTGANDPNRNLAPIGDENLFEHRNPSRPYEVEPNIVLDKHASRGVTTKRHSLHKDTKAHEGNPGFPSLRCPSWFKIVRQRWIDTTHSMIDNEHTPACSQLL